MAAHYSGKPALLLQPLCLCRAQGCRDVDCHLCQHSTLRRCSSEPGGSELFQRKYRAHKIAGCHLIARCAARIGVELEAGPVQQIELEVGAFGGLGTLVCQNGLAASTGTCSALTDASRCGTRLHQLQCRVARLQSHNCTA